VSDNARHKSHSVNKIFGNSLPDTTKDEREEDPSERDAERDDWLRDNVPPHHA
jgi:hypothetical protein